MKDLFRLFMTFFKIGLFTFGGGYAMISLIERDVVIKRKWMTREDMMNIVTIAEATPGPISVNTATFVGTKVKGVLGAFFATLGLVLPSFFIIVAISLILNEVKDIKLVNYALRGIQACVVVLIFNAFIKFFKSMEKSPISIILFIGAFAVSFFTGFNVVFIILIGAAFGLLLTVINVIRANKIKKSNAIKGENVDSTESNKEVESGSESLTDGTLKIQDKVSENENSVKVEEKSYRDNDENNSLECDSDEVLSGTDPENEKGGEEQ